MFSSFNVLLRSRVDLDILRTGVAIDENRSVSCLLHRIDCLWGTRTGDRTSVPAQDVSEVPRGVQLQSVGERSKN